MKQALSSLVLRTALRIAKRCLKTDPTVFLHICLNTHKCEPRATQVHLHPQKSNGFFFYAQTTCTFQNWRKSDKNCGQDRLHSAMQGARLGVQVHLHLHAPKSIGFFQTIFQIWRESDKNCGQDRLETRVHVWVHSCTLSAPTVSYTHLTLPTKA